MTDQHPITPPPELVKQWITKYGNSEDPRWQTYEQDIATQAARWGADQELDACCEFLEARHASFVSRDLHAARRPKPPSLAEEALEEVGTFEGMGTCNIDIIRRALERLQELEGQGDG